MSSIDDHFGGLISQHHEETKGQGPGSKFPESPLELSNKARRQHHGEGRVHNEIKISHVGRIYVQRDTKQPEQVNINCNVYYPLESDEQIWDRRYKVGEEWEHLDFGWLESISRILIFNLTGTDRAVIPTREQLEQDQRHRLSIRFEDSDNYFTIYPKDVLPIVTKSTDKLQVRSQFGETKLRVVAIPG